MTHLFLIFVKKESFSQEYSDGIKNIFHNI